MAYWSPAEPLPDLLGISVRWMLLFHMNSLPNAHLWLLIEPHWVIIGPLSHELASAGSWVPSTGVQGGFGPLPPRFNHRVRSVITCAACLCRVISNHGYESILFHVVADPCGQVIKEDPQCTKTPLKCATHKAKSHLGASSYT